MQDVDVSPARPSDQNIEGEGRWSTLASYCFGSAVSAAAVCLVFKLGWDATSAAWIQAVGSILAIAAAIWIANRQSTEMQRREERELQRTRAEDQKREQALARAISISAFMARRRVEAALEQYKEAEYYEEFISRGAYSPMLKDAMDLITDLHVDQFGDQNAVIHFMNLRSQVFAAEALLDQFRLGLQRGDAFAHFSEALTNGASQILADVKAEQQALLATLTDKLQ